MVRQLFSERERGSRPRTSETVDEHTWGGLVVLINRLIDDGTFGAGFPSQCPDGQGVDGCNGKMLGTALQAEADVEWPLRSDELPDDQLAIWDTLEFLFECAGKPIEGGYHSYFNHCHLSFDVEVGQQEFASAVNRLLARNGIAFELTSQGLVRRLLPQLAGDQLASALFETGDDETDRLLEAARIGITSPSLDNRRNGLEKLWDAFERLKTLEPGADKKARAESLLDKVASGPNFRVKLSEEAKELTTAGNSFRIRHSETTQEILQTAEQVDYLFFRMFAFLQLLLRSSDRGG